jgi:hypothetical protein
LHPTIGSSTLPLSTILERADMITDSDSVKVTPKRFSVEFVSEDRTNAVMVFHPNAVSSVMVFQQNKDWCVQLSLTMGTEHRFYYIRKEDAEAAYELLLRLSGMERTNGV